jgi:MFS family permease
MSVFKAKGDARDYLTMAAATFLVFLSHSTITFLAVILRDLGVGETSIGVIISAPLVPILAGMFLSGYLMERFGPLRVVRAGFVMIFIAHLSLEITVASFKGVYFSRAFHGFGYGIFMPASMTYVKGKLLPERMVHPFGIYASMILMPNIVGPWLMENLYASMGLRGLFLITALPSLLGNLLAQLPGAGKIPETGDEHTGYGDLLRMDSIRPLILAIFTVGLVYGIAGLRYRPDDHVPLPEAQRHRHGVLLHTFHRGPLYGPFPGHPAPGTFPAEGPCDVGLSPHGDVPPVPHLLPHTVRGCSGGDRPRAGVQPGIPFPQRMDICAVRSD